MATETAHTYLDAVDRALPGYVRGLYLVGSVALGAWQPPASDVDTVILTSRPATADDLTALAQIHAEMPRSPLFDGVYLEPGLAREWPDDRRTVPFVVNGEFQTDRPCGELTPVLWLTLQRHGIPVRGPAVADLDVRVDRTKLRRYNLDNLRGYWQAAVATFPTELADTAPDEVLDPAVVTWFVHGPARLHHTLAHGDIIAKTAAGDYLAQLFPEYAALAHRANRWRAGAPEQFTVADLRTAGDSVNAVADDAWRRYGD
ncbi:nucleotidyltransferase domain-containing protein [Jidongwangia harbinensis]|uniref:nucleotidyltransferase domain-containing protein n=1 Tax=Jidongwangia harbinensis TaxID=2878561 RepID=UPI001CD95507|nr:nucleotidyltransferase domain-containing protein [Jidongwangia harbinensis]MCA2215428.1 nucleotidyltransferase domain-containing protein [Jidongwangia harbinensis]